MNWREIGTKLSPRTIVLTYVVFGIAWALLFNWLPITLMSKPQLLNDLEYINHWIFIFASASEP